MYLMSRLPTLAFFIGAAMDAIFAGADAAIADLAARETADYWAGDAGFGDHARADEMVFHDTDAGMWESGE